MDVLIQECYYGYKCDSQKGTKYFKDNTQCGEDVKKALHFRGFYYGKCEQCKQELVSLFNLKKP